MRSMNRLMIAALIALMSTFAVACESSSDNGGAEAQAEVPEITVEALAGALEKEPAKVTVCDANGEDTRKEFGVIPGATLLEGYDKFDPNALAGSKDQSLVFYCSSEKCSAAPKAAAKAVEAGYKDVKVLRAGIKGWVKAGQKTDKLPQEG